jgi:hypothetical protein
MWPIQHIYRVFRLNFASRRPLARWMWTMIQMIISFTYSWWKSPLQLKKIPLRDWASEKSSSDVDRFRTHIESFQTSVKGWDGLGGRRSDSFNQFVSTVAGRGPNRSWKSRYIQYFPNARWFVWEARKRGLEKFDFEGPIVITTKVDFVKDERCYFPSWCSLFSNSVDNTLPL